MELLMKNMGKVMDNYLFSLKFTVSKTRLKMLCHVALTCTIYCITDMICTVACHEIEVVMLLGSLHLCLFLNYVSQTTKGNLSKLISNPEYCISKAKDKFLTTTVNIFFINNKICCTYFNPLMPGGSKRLNILKQTYSQKLLFILSMYDLFLPPGMGMLKRGIVKLKSFCEFLILSLFKETLIRN